MRGARSARAHAPPNRLPTPPPPSVRLGSDKRTLGIRPPRIKVQVKRKADTVTVEGLRSFMALLNDDDVGLFVTLGGFTKDAAEEARTQEKRKVTLPAKCKRPTKSFRPPLPIRNRKRFATKAAWPGGELAGGGSENGYATLVALTSGWRKVFCDGSKADSAKVFASGGIRA
jgi:hypothetical protein